MSRIDIPNESPFTLADLRRIARATKGCHQTQDNLHVQVFLDPDGAADIREAEGPGGCTRLSERDGDEPGKRFFRNPVLSISSPTTLRQLLEYYQDRKRPMYAHELRNIRQALRPTK